jgi:hypothetical protein
MKTFFEYLKERKIEKQKEEKSLEKKYNSLTLEQRNAYEQIMDRRDSDAMLYSIKFVLKAIFYLLVFGFMLTYLYGTDYLEPFKLICVLLLKCWFIFILAGFITDINFMKKNKELKKQLLNGVKN